MGLSKSLKSNRVNNVEKIKNIVAAYLDLYDKSIKEANPTMQGGSMRQSPLAQMKTSRALWSHVINTLGKKCSKSANDLSSDACVKFRQAVNFMQTYESSYLVLGQMTGSNCAVRKIIIHAESLDTNDMSSDMSDLDQNLDQTAEAMTEMASVMVV